MSTSLDPFGPQSGVSCLSAILVEIKKVRTVYTSLKSNEKKDLYQDCRHSMAPCALTPYSLFFVKCWLSTNIKKMP